NQGLRGLHQKSVRLQNSGLLDVIKVQELREPRKMVHAHRRGIRSRPQNEHEQGQIVCGQKSPDVGKAMLLSVSQSSKKNSCSKLTEHPEINDFHKTIC